ncbi:MAG: hypothetical protein JRG74_06335 [Deltaproteobacteria bacterium]|nr:hypothetical protein [Deltaproteobacteria bacterium]
MRLGKWIAIIFLLSIFAFWVPVMATDQGVASTHDTEHGFTHGAEHAVAETGHGDAGHGGQNSGTTILARFQLFGRRVWAFRF